jgi:hypothetical protein
MPNPSSGPGAGLLPETQEALDVFEGQVRVNERTGGYNLAPDLVAFRQQEESAIAAERSDARREALE